MNDTSVKVLVQSGPPLINALGGRLDRGDLRAVAHLPSGTLQPGQCSLVDGRL
jgi:hypothetical protein